MLFVDSKQCTSWVIDHEVPTDDRGHPSPSHAVAQGLRIWLPSELAKRTVFCKWLWRMVAEDRKMLVWVTDWSVWESSEHMPLAAAVRRGLGTGASLMDEPGCLVEPHESDDGMSLFLLATLFSWDCWLVADMVPPTCVFTSHDDYIDVYLPPGEALTDLAHFELQVEAIVPG